VKEGGGEAPAVGPGTAMILFLCFYVFDTGSSVRQNSQRQPKGKKDHHSAIRDMMVASSHVLSLNSGGK
jgi:hypothetical protein